MSDSNSFLFESTRHTLHLGSVDPTVVQAISAGVLAALRQSYEADAQASSHVHAVGEELQAAATALQQAAQALKGAGRAQQANIAIMAARRAAEAAQEVLGA